MRQLKIFHAADLHLDSEFASLSPEAAEGRRRGQREILRRIAEAAGDRGAQALLLAGDVFESDRVSPETQREFCRVMGELDMPVFISPGNHDPYGPACVWARMELPENLRLFKSESFDCLELPELNARFWGAGFEKAFCPPLLRDFTTPEKREGVFDLMVLHGDLGPGGDYCPISRAEIEKSGMDYIALGHIHTRSPLERAGKTAFAYPGCPEGRGYDELGEMGGYLITLTEEGVRAEFVPLGGARYEILKIELEGREPLKAINSAVLDLSDKDYCRIILTGEIESLIDLSALRRALEGRFAELQLRDETCEKRDVWAQAGQDSLAGLFLQKLKDRLETASPEERRKIELAAGYGLAALENGGGRL